eukprot:364785-Chlamydomonas_euryale.AAC.14
MGKVARTFRSRACSTSMPRGFNFSFRCFAICGKQKVWGAEGVGREGPGRWRANAAGTGGDTIRCGRLLGFTPAWSHCVRAAGLRC